MKYFLKQDAPNTMTQASQNCVGCFLISLLIIVVAFLFIVFGLGGMGVLKEKNSKQDIEEVESK